MKRILLALVMFLTMPAMGFGQTQKQALSMAEKIDPLATELNVAVQNLNQMSAGLVGLEASSVDQIRWLGELAGEQAMFVFSLAVIFSKMQNEQDRRVVHSILVMKGKQTASTFAKHYVSPINQNLPQLKSPAVIAEAQKIRDIIQKIQIQIQATIPNT